MIYALSMEFLRSLKKDDILDLFSHGFCSKCQHLLHSRITTTLGKRKLDETWSTDEGFEYSLDMPLNGSASNSQSLTGKQWDNPRNSSQRRDSATSVNKCLVGCKQSDFELLLNDGICEDSSFENGLSEEKKEQIRYSLVCCRKDFTFVEKVNGRRINVVQGLELHTEVFNALEQKKIVEWIYRLQWRGKEGKLKDRTYSEPRKWMRGKGRVTIQFGCCYNYAVDRSGNPPGIMRDEEVDPLPPVFKQIIKRMVRWNIVPSSGIPDSCIVNIYEEGDCIPPHIDHRDFVRPFYTVSFLSECKILFGSNLQIVSAGEFAGPVSISLPVGSVFVLKGHGADTAKHCIPSVSSKRISITFRKMKQSKLPYKFSPDPDLVGIKPLSFSSLNKSDKAQDEDRNLNIQQNKAESVESESDVVCNTKKASFRVK